MSDLIERLRRYDWRGTQRAITAHEAADLIEAQQAEIARLREALEEAVDVFDGMMDDEIDEELLPRLRAALSAQDAEQTRATGDICRAATHCIQSIRNGEHLR